MDTLLQCAEALVKAPPVDIYKALMKWWAQDLKKTQGDDCGVADNWVNQCKLRGGEKAATFSVAATCDMTAMCLMMAAAGVKRIEAMKDAIRTAVKNKAKGQVFGDDNSIDHVYFYRDRKDWLAFSVLFERWCALDGNGVIQFKFKAKDDWHTFALERVWGQEKDQGPRFLVYQSYQNVYRLADFLGMGDPNEQAAQMEVVWSYMPHETQETFGDMDGFIKPILERTATTAKTIGNKIPLDMKQLTQYVLEPLSRMLTGGVSNKDYVRMTASGATDAQLGTDTLAVMVCDHVSPDEYWNNYVELRKPSADLTMYPECE